MLKENKDVISAEPYDIHLQAHQEDETVLINGHCSTNAVLICSRCLSHYNRKLDITIEEVFTQNQEIAEADEDDWIQYVSGDSIDLIPVIEENITLGFPFISLCDESCQGLCPVCGQNKNEQDCGCKQETIDPRLAGLKDFFK